jgi:predicted metal-dependent peptidase
MPSPEVLTKLAKGRAIVRKRAPYLSALLYGLIPVEAPECPTMFVTPGLVMGYNPKFVEACTDELIAGCLAHEVNHPLRKTHERLATLQGDAYIKNVAADIPINEDLRNGEFCLPDFACFPETYGLPKGWTTEKYYEALLQMQQQQTLPHRGEPKVTGGQCGGGAGNSANPEVEKQLDAKYGRTKVDVMGKIAQAASDYKATKQRGFISADMQEVLILLSSPAKVRWINVLRHNLSAAYTQITHGGADYSLNRPSVRAFTRDETVISPGLVAYEPTVMLCLDTSGSMQTLELSTSFREIAGVIKALNINYVWFVEADSDVACKPRRLSLQNLRTITIHGRGGTDFRPAIKYAEKARPRPDILIYFTDGDGFVDSAPPKGIHVVWCVIGKTKPAPWGKVIYVDD